MNVSYQLHISDLKRHAPPTGVQITWTSIMTVTENVVPVSLSVLEYKHLVLAIRPLRSRGVDVDVEAIRVEQKTSYSL